MLSGGTARSWLAGVLLFTKNLDQMSRAELEHKANAFTSYLLPCDAVLSNKGRTLPTPPGFLLQAAHTVMQGA